MATTDLHSLLAPLDELLEQLEQLNLAEHPELPGRLHLQLLEAGVRVHDGDRAPEAIEAVFKRQAELMGKPEPPPRRAG